MTTRRRILGTSGGTTLTATPTATRNMSTNYGGTGRRTGQVNFSTFIQDLNVEVPSQDSPPRGEDWEKDMAMFTNTNFFDWEKATGGAAEFAGPTPQEPEKKPTVAAVSREAAAPAAAATSAVGDFDFNIAG